MEHRTEIDGLRAVAVIPVMLFHAGFESFRGGFVGVDVFFVISGYLITSIILDDLQRGSFSLSKFYERRARRILPALFVVMAVSLPLAWMWLLPHDFKSYSQSLAAVPLFATNILFWRESGYFATAAELKPLLHTWSLAVEEQFYLIFPLLLVAIMKLGRGRSMAILAFVALLSLVLAQVSVASQPIATFFLLPTRGWELAIGALVALHRTAAGRSQLGRRADEWLSAVGLGLVLVGVFAFSNATPFPSVYALVPTLGTALIILFGSTGTYVARILSARLMVGVGLISYSAYLWHQPLLAFARHRLDDPEPGTLGGLVVASMALAYVTWKFVERPFRASRQFTRQQIFGMAGAASVLFVAIGSLGVLSNGGDYRLSKQERDLLALGDYKSAMVPFKLRTCFIDYDQRFEVLVANECVAATAEKPRIVIFGDSEAAHLSYGVRMAFPADEYRIDQWTATSCRPADFSDDGDRCRDFYNYFVDKVLPRLGERDVLLVAGNWGNTEARMGTESFVRQMSASFGRLKQSKATIIVFGNAPDFSRAPIDQIVKMKAVGNERVYLRPIIYNGTNDHVRELARTHGFLYFDPFPDLCTASNQCLVYENGEPVFSDANHLSEHGSRMLIEHLVSRMREKRLAPKP